MIYPGSGFSFEISEFRIQAKVPDPTHVFTYIWKLFICSFIYCWIRNNNSGSGSRQKFQIHADPEPQYCFLMRIRLQNPYLAPRKRSLSSLAVSSVVLPWCCCVLAVHVEREDLMTPNSPRAAYLSMREPAGWNSNTLDNPIMPVSQ